MGLAETFTQIVESLPDDWTDLELDLRIFDERRYVDAAVLLVMCNAQPYSKHDWHWRLLVAHRFGHAAAGPTVHAALSCSTTRGSTASWRSRGESGAGRESCRCGGGPSRCARSSPACARSRWRGVVAFIPDLLFGSGVQSALRSAGHEVELVSELGRRIEADVLVVDLTRMPTSGSKRHGRHGGRKLAFYSHVEGDVRRLADGGRVRPGGAALDGWRARAAALVTKLGSNIA